MRKTHLILGIFFLLCIHATQPMHTTKNPENNQDSFFKTVTEFSVLIGSLFLEIVQFDSSSHDKIEGSRHKNRKITKTIVSNNLAIIAPHNIRIQKEGHRLLINGEYYDTTLQGKLYWSDGCIITKKGTRIDPLI